MHIHIGSPVYEIQPYVDAVNKADALIDRLTDRGHKIEWLDLGGGFAVNYERPEPGAARSPSTPRRCCRCCRASRTGSRWSPAGTSPATPASC